jgi:hypothetical protein
MTFFETFVLLWPAIAVALVIAVAAYLNREPDRRLHPGE